MLGPQTHRFAQFGEVFGLQLATFDKCAHVSRAQMRLLQRQLSSARERWARHRDKTQRRPRRTRLVSAHLKRGFDQTIKPRRSVSTLSDSIKGLGLTPATHTTPAVFISEVHSCARA